MHIFYLIKSSVECDKSQIYRIKNNSEFKFVNFCKLL